jgi:Transposase DDE domain
MLVQIFYEIDNFCNFLEQQSKTKLLGNNQIRQKNYNLSMSEIMTITVNYHYSGYKTFKDYYIKNVLVNMQKDFKNLVSYNRFLELQKLAIMPMMLFFRFRGLSKCTGISFIDSMPLKMCHIKRQYSHKLFKNVASKGKTSVGWFYGFKLHFVINDQGQIVDCYITPGNVSDNNKHVIERISKNLFGKLIADKGYIGSFNMLFEKGIQLIHKIRSNMKNKLILMEDKLLLRKRGLIESVGNILKNIFNIEHARHRSKTNFFNNIFSSLIAYSFKPSKPSLKTINLI